MTKVLHLSTFDRINGASIAAYRLHSGLLEAGVDSAMWVQNKVTSDSEIQGPGRGVAKYWSLLRPWMDRFPLLAAGAFGDMMTSASWLPRWQTSVLESERPDVLHLHWVQGGFIPVGLLRKLGAKIPIVWTFHDEWPFSGLRHYPHTNENPGRLYRRWDRKLQLKKQRVYGKVEPLAITPSAWMAQRARDSVVWKDLRTEVLPNPIDTGVFHDVDPSIARRLLKLPPDLPLVLFGSEAGAGDPRKGFDLLRYACRKLTDQGKRFGLVCFGNGSPGDLGAVPCFSLGWIHDDASLALAYSAADVVTLPSRMDNLPNTGVEASACGRPVVSFRVGGIPDIISDGESGYLCEPESGDELADRIGRLLDDSNLRRLMGSAARKRAEEHFSNEVVIPRFAKMYETVCGNSVEDC
tara:strand:- start:184 stop:1410 length:1227 start_codon:yes stop_codon:yes gene_type:complete